MSKVTFDLLDQDELRIMRQSIKPMCGVYFLWDGDELLYVGQSVNVAGRICNHFNEKARWHLTHFSFVEVKQSKFKPKHNRSLGNRTWTSSADESVDAQDSADSALMDEAEVIALLPARSA